MAVESGSLCPAAKAADIIGDKWTLLILREFVLGATRYSELQRAQPRMSPTILSKRLKMLESQGLIIRREGPNKKTKEYRLTRAGVELAPVLDQLSRWGLRWARRRIVDEDKDVGAFMWDFHRTLKTEELPDGETVFCITFPDVKKYKKWWLIASRESVDLCDENPGRDVDFFLTGSLDDFAAVWMGDRSINGAISDESILLTGRGDLTKSINRWFPLSRYADVRPKTDVTAP